MFQVNDTVLYGADGVCKIEEIKDMNIDGARRQYYVLAPLYERNTTHYVPVDNEKATAQLRQLLSPDEVHALIASMPEEESAWIADDNSRRAHYKELMGSGSRKGLVQIIRSLFMHRQRQAQLHRKLHAMDERMMQQAEKRLYEEFAYVLKIEPEQVSTFIAQQIELAASKS